MEKNIQPHPGLVEQFIYTPGFTRSYCCSTPIGVYETPNIWIKLAKMVDHSCIRGILISIRRIKIQKKDATNARIDVFYLFIEYYAYYPGKKIITAIKTYIKD